MENFYERGRPCRSKEPQGYKAYQGENPRQSYPEEVDSSLLRERADDGTEEYINESLNGGILSQLTAEEVKDMPHSLIGLITCLNQENKLISGSGILISPDLVLTCAHNIFNRELKK
jgi:hypothetical protein